MALHRTIDATGQSADHADRWRMAPCRADRAAFDPTQDCEVHPIAETGGNSLSRRISRDGASRPAAMAAVAGSIIVLQASDSKARRREEMAIGEAEPDTFPKAAPAPAEPRTERPAPRGEGRGIWHTVTWRELADEAAALAAALSARWQQRGAHVAWVGDNRPRLYAAICAAHWLGAGAVPLPGCSGREIAGHLQSRGHPRLRGKAGAGRQAARDPAPVPHDRLHRLRQGPGHAAV